MGETTNIGILALIPLLFWLVFIIFIIVFIVRLSRNKNGSANGALAEKLAVSEQVQQEILRRQQELADEVKEVNVRLKSIEQILKDVR